MTKPVGVNAQLATSCGTCYERRLSAAYPDDSHFSECTINQFLTTIKDEKLKILSIDTEVETLLKSRHSLPIVEFKFHMPNGYMHAVYAPNWISEGINMYNSMGFDGLSLSEFLQSLTP